MSDDFFDEIKQPNKKAKRASYSINEDVLKDFNNIADSKKYNKSKIIENFLKKFIESETSLVA